MSTAHLVFVWQGTYHRTSSSADPIILLSAVFTSLYTNTGATIKLQNVSTVAKKDKQNHYHQQRHQQQKNKSLFSGTCSAKHTQKVLDTYATRSLKLI
jgi:hypothetical protein